MATTAPASLNFQLVPRPIVERVYLATVATQFVNSKYQTYANQAGNPAVFNRFITRWKLNNPETDFEGDAIDLFVANSDQIDLPTRTNAFVEPEQWSDWKFWWGNISRSIVDVMFTSPELTERLMMEQTLGMARTFDKGIFADMRAKGGDPVKVYGSSAQNFWDFTDSGATSGEPQGNLTKGLLYDIIEDYRRWAIAENLALGSQQTFPLILVVHPYLVAAALEDWRDQKLGNFVPNINEDVIRNNRFIGGDGYMFSYAGVNVFASKQVANFTQPGSGQQTGTAANKPYMTCYGIIPQLSYTMLNGPALIIDRGPRHVGQLRYEHMILGGYLVEDDVPDKQFLAYVRSAA